MAADETKRTIKYGGYIHRFVAETFIPKPSPEHDIVIHIDHNNHNNHVGNLKWVNQAGLTAHNATRPNIIEDRTTRKGRFNKGYKLNEVKVKMLKTAIERGKNSTKVLAKQFGISEGQVRHIRRGGSWAHIEPDKA